MNCSARTSSRCDALGDACFTATPTESSPPERSTSRANSVDDRSARVSSRPTPSMIAQLTSESTTRITSTTCVAVLAWRISSFADVGTAPAACSSRVMPCSGSAGEGWSRRLLRKGGIAPGEAVLERHLRAPVEQSPRLRDLDERILLLAGPLRRVLDRRRTTRRVRQHLRQAHDGGPHAGAHVEGARVEESRRGKLARRGT